eukprot:909832-Ditylum_brightwellii.AAC.3
MELKRKYSEIVQSWNNEVLVLKKTHSADNLSKQSEIACPNGNIAIPSKSKDVAETRKNVTGHKTDKISELRDALEWERNEVKELKEEMEELKKMK